MSRAIIHGPTFPSLSMKLGFEHEPVGALRARLGLSPLPARVGVVKINKVFRQPVRSSSAAFS